MLTRADLAKYPFLNEASDYIKELGISIDDFLRVSAHLKELKWKLPNRVLDHGFVYVTREEMARLLEEEVRMRIVARTTGLLGRMSSLLENKVEQTRGLIFKWLGTPSRYE